jgi:hypothetical protein
MVAGLVTLGGGILNRAAPLDRWLRGKRLFYYGK